MTKCKEETLVIHSTYKYGADAPLVLQSPFLLFAITIFNSPSPSLSIPYRVTLGKTGLFPTASATHPPIKHKPPNGVTGPKTLNRCGSSVSR